MPTKIAALATLAFLTLFPTREIAARPDAAADSHLYRFAALAYRMVGPSRGGRVTAVAGHRSRRSTFYMGATGGGVWKTTDYGQTWNNISDGYFATGSIGAIRVADADADVIYVGTGSDGLRSNVIIGKGVYKSSNAGESWEHVGLEKVGNIGALLIHPRDPKSVYVAAIGNPFAPNPERGVYRSRDGGSSWQLVLFVSEKTGAVDLEFAPDNCDEIYATLWRAERKPWTIISGGLEGGVYKTLDGGDTWTQLTEGLPAGLRGKADLAVSAAAPERVYVLIEAPEDSGGLYRSDDRGETWSQVSDFDKIRRRPFYYTNLEAHPKNPDILWAMTEGFWKSEDAGKTWKKKRVPHGDNHDMWINPDDPDLFIQSNDGGANVTVNGGQTWSTQHNQPTAELYQVEVSDEFPYRLYAGQQDNSTISVPSLPPRWRPGGFTALWEAHGGCETGPAIPKPGDPDIVYANCKGRFGRYDRRTGSEQQYYVGFWNIYGHNPKDLAFRFQRVAPIHVSPHDPNRIYHASQYVHVTEDEGRTWRTISPDLTAFTPETQVVSGSPITRDVTGEEHFSAIYDVQESPHQPGVIWVGANDGPIHVTRDGGDSWRDVTPREPGPYGRVQNIEVSPHEPARAYAAVLRYQLGDFEPHVYRTSDYGESWTRITTGDNGIPRDHPVRVVREDPDREGLLYAGTEFGMFLSFDDGERWQSFQLNLPATPITDLKVVHKDLVLSTMGRGFWILDNLTPVHEASDSVALSEIHLFGIRDAYRLHPVPRDRADAGQAAPQYPPVGANIDYYLAGDREQELRLEISDADGTVIREFSSELPAPEDDGEAAKGEGARETLLERSAGLIRFTWDLRYPGPRPAPKKPEEGQAGAAGKESEEPALEEEKDALEERPDEKPGKGPRRGQPKLERLGPLVPPGTYRARLTAGDWAATRSFEVMMDPRALAAGITAADVEAQTRLALKVREALTRARRAVESIGDAEEALSEIRKQLVTEPIRYSRPMLTDQLEYLYKNLNRADQSPGRDAYRRFEELETALGEQLQKLERIYRATESEAASLATN